jgi:hypothetical protein
MGDGGRVIPGWQVRGRPVLSATGGVPVADRLPCKWETPPPGRPRTRRGQCTHLRTSVCSVDDTEHPLALWTGLEDRVGLLPLRVQAHFALICIEGVLWLESVWQAQARPSDLDALLQRLYERDDLDDRDEIAALAFAVSALIGSSVDGLSAVRRLSDSAFDRIPYPEGASSFRPLKEDAAHPVVMDELRWELSVAHALKTDPHVIHTLRARARSRSRPPTLERPL